MKNFNTVIKSSLVALILSASAASQAAIITYGGQAATDGSELTSSLISADNLLDAADGFFIETFDRATSMAGYGVGDDKYNYNVDAQNDGCLVNSAASALSITTSSSQALGVTKGSYSGIAAAPAGDTTCYGFTPAPGGPRNSWVEMDHTAILAIAGAGVYIDYLGFYWGSVDTYNSFEFFRDDQLVATLSGSDLLGANNGSSGNQIAPGSNQYVNIAFSAGEAFNRFRITTSGIAGEFDNIVIGLDNRATDIPEPQNLAIFALSLMMISFRSRRKAK